MMIPLLTSQQMAEADRLTIQQLGLPGMVLMENAGAGVVAVINHHYPHASRYLILAGRGNNGGDGFVIARRLLQQGCQVKVVLLGHMEQLKGDAALNAQVYHKLGGWLKELTGEGLPKEFSSLLAHSQVVVDALFGTGLSKPLGGLFAETVIVVNQSGKPVVAVDIASGVNADNGAILGVAIQASHTVTFGAEKIGHYTWPGAGCRGQLTLVDIGIPQSYLQAPQHRVAKNDLGDLTFPVRRADGHKGTFGHVLLVAGGVGKAGAAVLAAKGSQVTSPGLLTVACPESVQPQIAAHLLEVMTLPLIQGEEVAGVQQAGVLPKSLVIGPGLGESDHWQGVIQGLAVNYDVPLVLDADGLNVFSRAGVAMAALTKGRKAPVVITPHPGEMSRLLAISIDQVQKDRLATALAYAVEQQVWLVLKGAATVIASPQGEAWINPTGNAALASGGSGDLLAGLLGGFLAQGWPVATAVRAAVWLHGAAADRAVAKSGPIGVSASGLLKHLRWWLNQFPFV